MASHNPGNGDLRICRAQHVDYCSNPANRADQTAALEMNQGAIDLPVRITGQYQDRPTREEMPNGNQSIDHGERLLREIVACFKWRNCGVPFTDHFEKNAGVTAG